MQDTTEWIPYLKLCGKLAKEAARQGESPVGCVIIHAGKVVAKAREATKRKRDVTWHAEMEALRKARKTTGSDDFSAFTLLTTHEPCVMCSYAIRFQRVGRVVIGQATGFLGGVTSPFSLLTSHAVPAHWSSPLEVIFLDPLPAQPQSPS
jgi:tRNA(adenine34) deaminase